MPQGNNGLLSGLRKHIPPLRGVDIDGGAPGTPLGWRLRPATQSGPPTSGTWRAGDHVEDRRGNIFLCVTSGSGSAAVWAPVRPLFNVRGYGATGNGVTDDTAAIQADVADWAAAQAGQLYFPAGTYKVSQSGAITMNYPGQGILGDGRNASVLAPTSAVTGDVIRWQMNPWTLASAGTIQGLGIDGTNAGSGARGLHVGDVMGHVLRDFRSDNFTAGTGIYIDNVTHWTEELVWESVFTEDNLHCVTLDAGNGGTSSWEYNRMKVRVNLFSGQTGLTFQNGGVWTGTSEITGNNQGGTVVKVLDTCSLNGDYYWTCDGDGSSPVGLNMSSGGSLGGTGYIDFSNGGMTNTNAGSFNVQLMGWANLPGIGVATPGALTYVPQFAGGITLGSTPVYSGGFLPSFASTTGAFFLRTDAAGTPGQRLYICTNGGAGTWADITTIINLAAGTTSAAPLTFTSGSLLTTASAGAAEYDGAASYITNDTTSGRGLNVVEQKFRLTATGSNITTIANFFGSTSNISLVSGAEYEIEIDAWFLKNTAGAVTWTFTNSAAPTSMNIEYKLSPATGIVSTAAATALFGEQYNITTTAPTVVSGSLTTAVNHHHRFWIRLINGTGTSLKIQATAGAGSVTPGIGSSWKARRVPAANVGTFAA